MAYFFSGQSHTFNEYLLVPGYSSSECIPDNVSLRTPLTRFRAGEEPALPVDDGDGFAGSGIPRHLGDGAGKDPGVAAAQRFLAPRMKFQNRLTHNSTSLHHSVT